jgi:hypothetical protein
MKIFDKNVSDGSGYSHIRKNFFRLSERFFLIEKKIMENYGMVLG